MVKLKTILPFLLSLTVLEGCTRSLDTPSEIPQDIPQIEVIESSSEPEPSSESASSSEASGSSSSSEAESSQPEPPSSQPPVKEPEPTPSSSTPPPPASTQQPVQLVSTLTITFVDSNGVPAAYQEVTYEFGVELSVASLGKTDANGRIVFHPQAVGEYTFYLDYTDNERRVDHGFLAPMGPVNQVYKVTELGRTEEITHVIEVYPIVENTPSENCIAFTLLGQDGKPLKNIRLFYKEATGSEDDYLDMDWIHIGPTNENGQFFFQNPKAGDYLFMFHHPESGVNCHIPYTLTDAAGQHDITHIVGPTGMY